MDPRIYVRNQVKGYEFFSFARHLYDNKYGKKILDTATKAELDVAKTALKKQLIKQVWQ